MAAVTTIDDQARLPAFRVTLLVQAAAAFVFGLAPLLLTGTYATALGFSGNDVLVYRLGGAATTGYLVASLVAIAWRSGWAQIRIPAIGTLTFTIGALLASVVEFLAGNRQPVIAFVIAAGAVFTVIAAFWVRLDRAEPLVAGQTLGTAAKAVLALATLSAATFGLLPLVAPVPFASLFGLAGTDTWVFRLAW